MLKLRDLVAELGDSSSSGISWSVVTVSELGADFAVVLLPSDSRRVPRMNEFWDLLGEREVLVVAICPWGRRRARRSHSRVGCAGLATSNAFQRAGLKHIVFERHRVCELRLS